MELELALKITRTKDDTTSTTNFRIAKDPFGTLFWSKETNSMFILVIHLKGFRREKIEIEINKEGNRIAISGKKAVEEMVLIRWIMWKKEVELRAFRKVFRIPDIVDLDRIKAKFNEEESTLKITMPKKVKGNCGVKIEEEEEEEEEEEAIEDRGNSKPENAQTESDNVPERASSGEAMQKIGEEPKIEKMEETGRVVEEAEINEKELPEEPPKEETFNQAKIQSTEEQKEESKEFHERDGKDEIGPEKSKEPQSEKGIDHEIEEKVPERVEAQLIPKQSEEPKVMATIEEAAHELEPPKESAKSIPKEAAPLETTTADKETMAPESTEPPLSIEEHPDVNKKSEVEKAPEAKQKAEEVPVKDAANHQATQKTESPLVQVEERKIIDDNHQNSDKQEPSTDVEESTKPEPGKEEMLHPNHEADKPIKDEVHEQDKETTKMRDRIEEATDEIKPLEDNKEANEHESQEREKKKDLNEGAALEKKSRRPKLYAPCSLFNEEESTLKITMPKKVKGICGVKIEEEKEEEKEDRRNSKPENTQTEAYCLPKKASREEAIQEIGEELKIEKMEETCRVVEEGEFDKKELPQDPSKEETFDQAKIQSTEEQKEKPKQFPERDGKNEIEQKISKKSESEKGIEQEIEKSVPERVEAQLIPKESEEPEVMATIEEEAHEPEPPKESAKSIPEVAAPLATTTADKETMAPESTEPPLSIKEPPDVNKKSEVEKVPEAKQKAEEAPVKDVANHQASQKTESPLVQVEERKIIDDNHQNSVKQESSTDVEESTKSELEKEETLHPNHEADKPIKDEVHEQDENSKMGDRIGEATDEIKPLEDNKEANEYESQERENKKDLNEGAAPKKKSRTTKLYAPCSLFNEEESTLKITMPKKVKRICGVKNEEEKEEKKEEDGRNSKPENTQTEADCVPKKVSRGEAIQEIGEESNIGKMEETCRVVEEGEIYKKELPEEPSKKETFDRAKIQSTEEQKEKPKEFPERDGKNEIEQEKSKKSESEKGIEQEIEKNVPERVEAHLIPKESKEPEVMATIEEEAHEPEPLKESAKSIPEEAASLATTTVDKETMAPESTEPPLSIKEPPDVNKKSEVEKVPEAKQKAEEAPVKDVANHQASQKTESSLVQVEERKIIDDNHQNSVKQEPSTDVEESTKPELEKEETLHPNHEADKLIKDEVHEQDENTKMGDRIEEAIDEIKPLEDNKEANEHESQERENKKDLNEGAAPKKKSRTTKLYAPCSLFNEEESTLKITMPKKVKGNCGVKNEEEKDEKKEEEYRRNSKPETTQTEADCVPKKVSSGVAIQEIGEESKIEKMEDTCRVVEEGEIDKNELPEEPSKEETFDRAKIQSTEEQKEKPKELPERDSKNEIEQEKSKKSESQKGIEQEIEKNVPERVEAQPIPKESEEPDVMATIEEAAHEPEPSKESTKPIPEEAAPLATTTADKETMTPESTEPPLSIEEPPDVNKKSEVEKVPEAKQKTEETPVKDVADHQASQKTESPSVQVEEKNIIDENHQNSDKKEPGTNVEESTKREPEKEETLHPDHKADKPIKDEVHEQEEETTEMGDRTEEATDEIKLLEDYKEVNELENQEGEKKKDQNEGADSKIRSRRPKLCAPCSLFNEEESTLKITMPKKVKGICGVKIDDDKEEEEQVFEDTGNAKLENTQTEADYVPERASSGEVISEMGEEPKIEKMEETSRVVEEAEIDKKELPEEPPNDETFDQAKIQSTEEQKEESKEFHEGDSKDEIGQEKSKEPESKKGIEQEIEEKVPERVEAQLIPKESEEPKVMATIEEAAHEPELPKESAKSIPEEAAPLETTTADKEAMTLESTKSPLSNEEPHDVNKMSKVEKVPEAEQKVEELVNDVTDHQASQKTESPLVQVEEIKIIYETHQNSDNQETNTDVEQSTKPEPEKEETLHPDYEADKLIKDEEVHDQEDETTEMGDRMEEVTDEIKPSKDNKEANEHESQEEEKKKVLNEGAAPKKKSGRPKLSAPCSLFNEEESTLQITMPKKVKGICKVKIQEDKEEEEEEKVFEDRENSKPKNTQTEVNHVPERTSGGEVIQEMGEELKIEKVEETGRIVEEAKIDKKKLLEETQKEETFGHAKIQSTEEQKEEPKEFPERDSKYEIEPEKSKEPESEKGIEQEIEENVHEKVKAQLIPKESEEPEVIATIEEETHELEPPKESAKPIPEEATPLATTPKDKEITTPESTESSLSIEEPSNVSKKSEVEKVPETEQKADEARVKDVADHQASQKTESPLVHVEERKIIDENYQNSDKQEPITDVEESTKPEPGREETFHSDHVADKPIKDEVHEQEETTKMGDRIKEATDEIKPPKDNKEVNKHESQEREKKKDLNEGAIPKKKSRRPKFCTPCFVAGSAFLFSLIVIVIRLTRSKKR